MKNLCLGLQILLKYDYCGSVSSGYDIILCGPKFKKDILSFDIEELEKLGWYYDGKRRRWVYEINER